MKISAAVTSGPDWRAAAPALFLLLAAALGGLRELSGWAVFSALFIGYLLAFEKEFSFSLTLPLGLLLVWLAAGLYFSPEPLNSFWHFSKYLVFLLFFAFLRARGEEAGKYWIGAVAALGGLAAAFALFERALGAAPAGIIGSNQNYGAAFMAAALAGCAAVWSGKSARAALPYGAAAALLFAGILAANSRGAFLAAAASVLFLLYLNKSRWGVLSLAGALLLAAAMLPSEHLNELLKLRDPRSFARLSIWKTAFEAIAAQPVFGCGLGLFERVFEFFKFPFFDGVSWYGHSTLHAHSEPLNLAAEAGLPAAALLAWAWCSGVFAGKGAAPAGKLDLPLKIFAFALFAEAAVDVIFYSGAVQLCFFGTLGLLAPRAQASPERARAGRAALCLAALALAAALALRGGFERDSACAMAGAGPGPGAACLKRAIRFSPGDAKLRAAAVAGALNINGNPARAAALADDAAYLYPKDPFLAQAAAEACFAGGDMPAAKDRLSRAVALEPNFLSARLGLVQLLAREKDKGAAAAEFEKLEKSMKTMKESPPRSVTDYDRALLYLPPAAYGEIRKWKKILTGANTASVRKTR